LLIVAVLLYGCGSDPHANFTVSNPKTSTSPQPFSVSSAGRFSLTQVLVLGDSQGTDERVFGFVEGAIFGPNDDIYVADYRLQRIAVYDSAGGFKRFLGRKGQGPGELLSPYSLTFLGDTLLVFDDRQGRVSAFDTSGSFLWSFQSPAEFLRTLKPGPAGSILATTGGSPSLLIQLSSRGDLLNELIHRPLGEGGLQADYVPEPGPICQLGSHIIYANPWVYELLALSIHSLQEEWSQRFASDFLRPVDSPDSRKGGTVRGGTTLGLACDSTQMVLGYIDLQSGRIRYDLLDASGRPLGRLEYTRTDNNPGYPGFLGDLRHGKVLGYRAHPFPQVTVWRSGLH
jgi:hypothetical protein